MAMKLHTKDQAPKEGGKEASQHPMAQVFPTTIQSVQPINLGDLINSRFPSVVQQMVVSQTLGFNLAIEQV